MSSARQDDALLIVNPASAGGRTVRLWPAIREALVRERVPHSVHFTTAAGEATTVTRQALRAGHATIVAVGGDGTLNEVVNGWFDEAGKVVSGDAALGLIPSGTGGDFRRSAGLLDAAAAVSALRRGRTHRLDAGRIDAGTLRHHFINIADWGVGGEVVAGVNASRLKAGGIRGSAVFLGISMRELLGYGVRAVRLRLDGEEIARRVSNVVIANGRYFGGGMRIAPKARLDDGLFDVVLVGEMSRWRTLAGVPRIYRGSHLTMPGVELFRAREVVVTPADERPLRFEAEGELIGAGAATVTCLPGAIPFILR